MNLKSTLRNMEQDLTESQKKIEMDTFVQQIREKYPNPSSDEPVESSTPQAPGYSVFGALEMFVTESDDLPRFPDARVSEHLLRQLNPELDFVEASRFVFEINVANGGERFDEAWEYLAMALSKKGFLNSALDGEKEE